MHYYRFHIGDYAKDTSHLSPIEDIAYRRLLDWYYLNEKPIDPSVIARLIRMGEYATVVNDILLEFFDQDENGFVSQRADSEIIAFRQYGESKRNAALKRWESTSNADAMHVHSSSNAINHKPITNNHKPVVNTKKRVTALPDGFCISPRVLDWAEKNGHGRLHERLEQFLGYAKRSGKKYVDWDEALMSAIREDWAKLTKGNGNGYTNERDESRKRAYEQLTGKSGAAIDGVSTRLD